MRSIVLLVLLVAASEGAREDPLVDQQADSEGDVAKIEALRQEIRDKAAGGTGADATSDTDADMGDARDSDDVPFVPDASENSEITSEGDANDQAETEGTTEIPSTENHDAEDDDANRLARESISDDSGTADDGTADVDGEKQDTPVETMPLDIQGTGTGTDVGLDIGTVDEDGTQDVVSDSEDVVVDEEDSAPDMGAVHEDVVPDAIADDTPIAQVEKQDDTDVQEDFEPTSDDAQEGVSKKKELAGESACCLCEPGGNGKQTYTWSRSGTCSLCKGVGIQKQEKAPPGCVRQEGGITPLDECKAQCEAWAHSA